MKESFGLDEGDRCGGWVPFYHDMGLISTLLLPLYLGGGAAFISPTAFLRRPHSWLDLIDRYDLRYSAAPDFAYERCVRKVSPEQVRQLDLSRWRTAVNGAEPVRAATVRAFQEHFAPAGLRPETMCPGYGLAEVTLCVTSCPPDRDPVVRVVDPVALEQDRLVLADEGRELVSCGPVPSAFGVRVVDPATEQELPDGRVGEIWLSGPSVAAGYWGLEEETERTFHARGADGSGPFLRTGDLGACLDGELFVCGRRKELLIVHGRNVYPQDVEVDVRAAHPALADGIGVVFALDTDDRVVVVHEVGPSWMDEPAALQEAVTAIKTVVSNEHGLSVRNVVLVRPRAVRRSTSGKPQRLHMRDLFLAGALEPVHQDCEPGLRQGAVSRERVLDSLLDRVTELLGSTEDEKSSLRNRFPDLRLHELGLTSLTAVRLRYHVLTDWQVDVSPQQLIGGPTVGDVVDLIHQSVLLRQLAEAPDATGAVEELTL
jgi:acyl-CoA synthetase (AMP-forming)/AMP-acid ligase II